MKIKAALIRKKAQYLMKVVRMSSAMEAANIGILFAKNGKKNFQLNYFRNMVDMALVEINKDETDMESLEAIIQNMQVVMEDMSPHLNLTQSPRVQKIS